MEEFAPVRLIKPVTMFVLAFISARYLFGTIAVALPLASIPLFLGSLGLLTNIAYKATALLTVSALTWASLPQGVHSGVSQFLSHTLQDEAAPPAAPASVAPPGGTS
jgi:hypothetical protein